MARLFFILVIAFLNPVYSQKQIDSQNHAWVMYTGNHRLTQQWGIHTEYQWRRSDLFDHWQQSLMRLGVDHYLPSGVQLTLGYGWIKTFPYGSQPIAHFNNEHRIWQQLILKNKAGRVDFQHRYRLEQRFIENWENLEGKWDQEGYLFRQRVRYRFLISVPLTAKELKDNTLFLSLYDEPFLGFGKGIGKNILDQNRLYAALGWRFNKDCNIQLGYMNQYVVKSDGIKAERNHTLQIGITYNLDLTN